MSKMDAPIDIAPTKVVTKILLFNRLIALIDETGLEREWDEALAKKNNGRSAPAHS